MQDFWHFICWFGSVLPVDRHSLLHFFSAFRLCQFDALLTSDLSRPIAIDEMRRNVCSKSMRIDGTAVAIPSHVVAYSALSPSLAALSFRSVPFFAFYFRFHAWPSLLTPHLFTAIPLLSSAVSQGALDMELNETLFSIPFCQNSAYSRTTLLTQYSPSSPGKRFCISLCGEPLSWESWKWRGFDKQVVTWCRE